MKRIAALAALSLTLAACSGIPVATVTVTEQPAERTVTKAPSQNERLDIMDLLESQDPQFGRLPRADVVEVAQMVCEKLDEGYAATTLGNLAIDAGFTQKQAASLIAASILVYCPWQEDNVR